MKADSFLFIIAVLAILVMGILLALTIAYPQGLLSHNMTYVTVTGSGVAYAIPSNATIFVTLNGTGSTPAIATSNLSLTLNEFNYTILKYAGGNSSRITTQSYSLYKVYNKSAYSATETVSVSIPSISNVTPALTALSLIQNVYINSVSSQLSQQQTAALTSSALQSALDNATAQAEQLSGNAVLYQKNVTVSKNYIYYPYYSLAANANPVSGQGPLYFNGREGVSEQVTVVFTHR